MVPDVEAYPERSPNEMVEVVDVAGEPVGLVTRATMRPERLRHRSVFVAVVSGDGDLLVHRRADTKDLWPGWWDLAIGGVCAPGETWSEAASRELSEELGVQNALIRSLGTGAYEDDQVSLVSATYICQTDGPFSFSDGEISEAHWAPPAEIAVLLASRRFLPDSVALVLPRLDFL